jgi:hypothetical protein
MRSGMRSWSKCVIFSRRMKSSSSVGPRSPAFSECWLSATGTPWFVLRARAVESTRTRSSGRTSGFWAMFGEPLPVFSLPFGSGDRARAGDRILRLHERAGRRRGCGGRIVFARLVGVERKRRGQIRGRRDLFGERISARRFAGICGTTDGGTAAAHIARRRLLRGHATVLPSICRASDRARRARSARPVWARHRPVRARTRPRSPHFPNSLRVGWVEKTLGRGRPRRPLHPR